MNKSKKNFSLTRSKGVSHNLWDAFVFYRWRDAYKEEVKNCDCINDLLARYGVKFGI